jgi:hypothetical protein
MGGLSSYVKKFHGFLWVSFVEEEIFSQPYHTFQKEKDQTMF